LEVDTLAPGGVLSTVKFWLVPRVTVAQAGRVMAAAASAIACTPKRAVRMEIMEAPNTGSGPPPRRTRPANSHFTLVGVNHRTVKLDKTAD
jgi:hypothetical protein